jgi:hypothetical protein
MKSGNLNFLEPSGSLQACNGTAFFEGIRPCHSYESGEKLSKEVHRAGEGWGFRYPVSLLFMHYTVNSLLQLHHLDNSNYCVLRTLPSSHDACSLTMKRYSTQIFIRLFFLISDGSWSNCITGRYYYFLVNVSTHKLVFFDVTVVKNNTWN